MSSTKTEHLGGDKNRTSFVPKAESMTTHHAASQVSKKVYTYIVGGAIVT
jgi:hypothetical protein